MTGPSSTPFKVVYSEVVQQAIRHLAHRAIAAGKGTEVRTALQAIESRLRSDPRTFGEAKYQYHSLQLEYRVAFEAPLFVQFSVHLARPIVFVKKIDALSGHGI